MQPDRRGEHNPRAKLKPQDVREIVSSADTYEALAERYSIHPTYVWKLKTGKRWRHLDEGEGHAQRSLRPSLSRSVRQSRS